MNGKFEVILFDLGGVLVELGSSPFPIEWFPDGSTFDVADWFNSETALRFERGLISPEDFADRLRQELCLPASSAEVIEHFSRWPTGLYSGAHELLLQLKEGYRLAAFTNTNILHWPRLVHEFQLLRYFAKIFASHQISLAKPDPRAFRYVIDTLEVTPEQILFFDDNPVNVAAARQLGVHGLQAHSVAQVEGHLQELGLLGEGRTSGQF